MNREILYSVKPHLGRQVNLHLKDGSVIVNVQLTKANGKNGGGIIQVAKPKGKTITIPVKEVDWIQPLNPWTEVERFE